MKIPHISPIVCAILLSPFLAPPVSFCQVSELERVPCGEYLSFEVPQEWEPSHVSFAAVQCAFKNPTSGYPNVNIVVEPVSPGDAALSTQQKIQRVIESYKGIGLTDTTLVKEVPFTVIGLQDSGGGGAAFAALLHHTGERAPMAALVAVFYLGERRFILTLLDVREAFRLSEAEALSVIRSIRLSDAAHALGNAGRAAELPTTGAPVSPSLEGTTASGSLTPIALGIGGAVILIALAALFRQRRQ